MFAMAREISEASGGAFDITVGPLVNAWGFGPENPTPDGPSDEELIALRERVDYRKVEVNVEECTIRKARPDIYCDLGAIAKGYAVDLVAVVLEDLGFTNYMVEVGGEVRAHGVNANGVPWQIGIEKPDVARRTIQRTISLVDMGMATSGDYRNYYERDGVRLSHTIDPRIGRPIAHKLASVTVLHKGCAMADGYATAFMVLGLDEGYALAENLGMAALFIVRDESGGFIEKPTPAFLKMHEDNAGSQ